MNHEKRRAAPERTTPLGHEAYIRGTTLRSSAGPAWREVFVQVFSRHREQAPFLVPAVAEPLLVWVISGAAVVEERDLGGEWSGSRVGVGDFFLTRSEAPYEMRWQVEGEQPFEVMHVYLSVPMFERVAREVLGSASVTLQEVSGGRDPALSALLGLFHAELSEQGSGGALYVGGLAQSLAVHLVRRYAAAGGGAGARRALPGAKLRRALAFMEAHLGEPFSLERVARAAGLSTFHFSRLFKRATGLAPSHHFIRQRVARAQRLLKETDASIIDVGMAVGYTSPSHFAQIFRRETGLSPSDYRGA